MTETVFFKMERTVCESCRRFSFSSSPFSSPPPLPSSSIFSCLITVSEMINFSEGGVAGGGEDAGGEADTSGGGDGSGDAGGGMVLSTICSLA